MTDQERAFREYELGLRREELNMRQQELSRSRQNDERQSKLARRTIVVASVSVVVSLLVGSAAVSATVINANRQANSNAEQFHTTSRNTYYKTIIDGLSSSSVAVQTGSMLLLTQYVVDSTNYDTQSAQADGARNALQTLAVFIEDKSTDLSKGLPDYESPQPVIVSRAMNQIKALDSDSSLGSHDADVSRANLHGISLPTFTPNGSFLAVAADLRRANLTGLNLTAQPASLRRAFFTCANLTAAKFGNADLAFADLSGANLTGADLSRVTNLTPPQLAGATIDKATKLPVHLDGSTPWGQQSQKCVDIVDNMTGMLGGQGYDNALPCPISDGDPLPKRFVGTKQSLFQVCAAREGL